MKISFKFSKLPMSAAMLCAVSTSASAAVIELTTNGNFETGDTTSWASFPSSGSTFGVTGDSFAGSFAGELDNPTQQSAALIKQANMGVGVVAPGDTITISFVAKGMGEVGGVQFAEFFSEISGGGVSSSEILGGAPLFLTATFQPYSFTATAGSDVSGGVTLQFNAATGAASGSTSSMILDNVSVTVDAVPEPSSSMLLALPLLGFMARRRR